VRMVKITLIVACVIFLLMPSGVAQTNPDAMEGAPGCGAPGVKFEVKTDKGTHSAQPEPGKALIYFLQDDSDFSSRPRPTTRMGIDGTWVGATQSNSYFYISVDPGVHHLCASWQSTVGPGTSGKTAAAHFTAEANGVYYFEAKDKWLRDGGPAGLYLKPMDSDEGQLIANKFSFSVSQPKK
jgi:hypothetical protein